MLRTTGTRGVLRGPRGPKNIKLIFEFLADITYTETGWFNIEARQMKVVVWGIMAHDQY